MINNEEEFENLEQDVIFNIPLTDDVIIEIEPEPELESKHKVKGKHSLRYDSIIKGKKDDVPLDEFHQDLLIEKNNINSYDTFSLYDDDPDTDEYIRLKDLKEHIHTLLVTKTNVSMRGPRRKPNRLDFNHYMKLATSNIDMNKFTYSEVFIELSYYFSDNIVNMFKLLDKYYGGIIAKELAVKTNIKFDNISFQ